MPDTPHALIRDTLAYLKDPLLPKQSPFATEEECALLQRKQAVPAQVPIARLDIKPSKPNTWVMNEVDPPKMEKPEPKVLNVAPEVTPAPKAPTPAPPPVEVQPQIKKMLQRIAPAMKLVDQVPDDEKAKRIANAWKERIPDAEVVLFASDSETETLDLLKALAKAIDQNLAKPKILMAEKFEREKRWDLFLENNPLRLIIATAGIEKFPEFMRFYKPSPIVARLNETPLLVLSPTSIYKSLEQKAILWKTLCQMLKK